MKLQSEDPRKGSPLLIVVRGFRTHVTVDSVNKMIAVGDNLKTIPFSFPDMRRNFIGVSYRAYYLGFASWLDDNFLPPPSQEASPPSS